MQFSANYNLSDYFERIVKTDNLEGNYQSLSYGLFGEVGSLLSSVKKLTLEGKKVYDYDDAVNEELGDTFWYFCRLTSILGFSLQDIVSPQSEADKPMSFLATNIPGSPVASLLDCGKSKDQSVTLLELAKTSASLLERPNDKKEAIKLLSVFYNNFMHVISLTDNSFSQILKSNLDKVEGRFLDINKSELPNFDVDYEEDERLPDHFQIEIVQKANGKTYMKWQGVFIGDPLTDNIKEEDFYRFHDVFHMANAAILHWSPTFRSLIKHKRKSDVLIDEQQDSGRAIVIEEGLTAWVFSVAKRKDFFDGHDKLSFGMLKTIREFVRGYEVEQCPLSLWEKAILDGYCVFREIKRHKAGFIIGDRKERSLRFELNEQRK